MRPVHTRFERLGCLSAVVLAALSAAAAAQPGSIQFIPALPGGQPYTIAYAATPDGQFVVGYSGSTQGAQAFRWNRVTGHLDALGSLGTVDWFRSKAYGISDDGNVVVGRSDTGDHGHPYPAAFKWTPQSGMTALPYASTTHQLGPQGNAAVGVSADGSVIVGRFESYATDSNGVFYYPALMHEWCRWTAGEPQLLPSSNAAFAGIATAVSADGTKIVGFSGDAVQAVLLDNGTAVPVGHLSGGQKAEPTAISRDGTTVVGWGNTLDPDGVLRFHAFRWQAGSGIVDLGGLAGLTGPSKANGVSGDGAVVVGAQASHALMWDAANGWRDLAAVLAQRGVDLQGKVPRESTWVSPDGTWIAGAADDPAGPMIRVGWIAHLPPL